MSYEDAIKKAEEEAKFFPCGREESGRELRLVQDNEVFLCGNNRIYTECTEEGRSGICS